MQRTRTRRTITRRTFHNHRHRSVMRWYIFRRLGYRFTRCRPAAHLYRQVYYRALDTQNPLPF